MIQFSRPLAGPPLASALKSHTVATVLVARMALAMRSNLQARVAVSNAKFGVSVRVTHKGNAQPGDEQTP